MTRCDVAVDLYGDTVFAELEQTATRVAGEHGLVLRKIAHPIDSKLGETIYVGSRSSAVFCRIYEKGKADRSRMLDVDPGDLDRWVRIELELKPQKDMKALAARIEPEEFWGVSSWTLQLAAEALKLAPEPIPFHPRRTTSDERSFIWMCNQYRNLLHRRCTDAHGGDRESLGAALLAMVFQDGVRQTT